VLSLLLYLPGIVLPFFRASLTDEVAFRWLGWHGYGGWITVTGKTFLLLTLADLVALLGMYCFQDWGRASFLALNIVWIALLPFCGLVVVTAWERCRRSQLRLARSARLAPAGPSVAAADRIA